MTLNQLVLAPFNQILGTASVNVPAYSNTDDESFSIERHYMHGIFMGIKWQCVEYARRWLLLRKGCVFKNIRTAADIWSEITHVDRVSDGKEFALKTHPNGSPTLPTIDSFLIYCRSDEQPVGHIAVICQVGTDHIRIAEQNNKFHYWDGEYAREIPLIIKDGLYYIEDEDPVYGWMEIEDDHQLKPLDELGVNAVHSRYIQPPPTGKIERCVLGQTYDISQGAWLNRDDPAEGYFGKHYAEDFLKLNGRPEHLLYYKINFDFLMNVAGGTNELNRMFLEATDRVIQTDELLTRFGVPQLFWNRIRQSWSNDQHLTMTGRFDLAFDGTQIKAFEYDSDSPTMLFQCAIIQKKWAEAAQLPSLFTAARRLHGLLVNNWKKMKITTKVHLLVENKNDQILTALYIQNVMKEADIESKLCIGTEQFFWKDKTIVDSDDQPIQLVWKLWMWDTVFEDYVDGTKENNLHHDKSTKHPRISDVLLHDQIQVIEPLWKVITSNKGLLPVLSQMYPNHPNLIHTEWNLTNELKQNSFVKKPIVGRYGHDITMYTSQGDSVIAQTTEGNFSTRDSIYQELFPAKNNEGHYFVINSWIIRKSYAGLTVREDQNLISNSDGPVTPCCVVWEEEK